LDDLIAEKEGEVSSGPTLSDVNQAKLRDILSLLQGNVHDLVKDIDHDFFVIKTMQRGPPPLW
jgi:hypothetical protein